MDQEPDVIREQIEETRSALTEKLETLETEVMETVHTAKDAVTDTIEAVKDNVEQTVDSVKETFSEGVEAVKHTFDLRRQVDQHPWPMLGGSVALGFTLGMLLPKEHWVARTMSRHRDDIPEPRPDYRSNAYFRENRSHEREAREEAPSTPRAGPEPGMFDQLTEKFGPEIAKLKGMAIGAFLGLVRDMVKRSLPEHLAPQMEEVMNNITRKVGGEPVRGPLLKNDHCEQPSQAI